MKNGQKIWTKKHSTNFDYKLFHDEDSISIYREDSYAQVGHSYAHGRIKVLAEITEGCQAILNVKLFTKEEFLSENAVEDKCADRQQNEVEDEEEQVIVSLWDRLLQKMTQIFENIGQLLLFTISYSSVQGHTDINSTFSETD